MNSENGYTIELPAFTGPLDLLLHLIDREELDITAISLAKVTRQYLDQVEQLKQRRMESLIDFLVIGARLALIKSRALLPQTPTVLIGELEEEEDPGEALARQLRRYRRFKRVAAWLAERETNKLRAFLRVAPPPQLNVKPKLDLTGVDANQLRQLLWGALYRMQQSEESVNIVGRPLVTVEGQIDYMRFVINRRRQIVFRELLSAKRDSVELAVTFLATLELIKRRELTVSQEKMFGPIMLYAAPAANGSEVANAPGS